MNRRNERLADISLKVVRKKRACAVVQCLQQPHHFPVPYERVTFSCVNKLFTGGKHNESISYKVSSNCGKLHNQKTAKVCL